MLYIAFPLRDPVRILLLYYNSMTVVFRLPPLFRII